MAKLDKNASKKSPAENNDKDSKPKQEKETESGDNPLQKDYSEKDFQPAVEEESYGWLIFKTIIIMGVIVAGFYYFLKYVTKKTGVQVLGQDAVEILSMVPVGQNKYLQIIDLAGKLYVLGIAENSINLITEIDDRGEIDKIRLLSSRTGKAGGKGFHEYVSRHLGGFLGRINEKRSGDRGIDKGLKGKGESGLDLDYLKRQRKRLRDLNGFNDE